MSKKITLLVDEEWLEAINKFTLDVHEGEVCDWLSVEEVEVSRDLVADHEQTRMADAEMGDL